MIWHMYGPAIRPKPDTPWDKKKCLCTHPRNQHGLQKEKPLNNFMKDARGICREYHCICLEFELHPEETSEEEG